MTDKLYNDEELEALRAEFERVVRDGNIIPRDTPSEQDGTAKKEVPPC